MVKIVSLQVKALEFNRLSPNLLASGGADGELKIWDISDPKSPTPYPAVAVSDWTQYTCEMMAKALEESLQGVKAAHAMQAHMPGRGCFT